MFDFKFDWQPQMATGIEEVDEQHKQLLSMGRDIEQVLQINCIGTTEQQLLDIVCGFRNFTAYHFYTEEVLMEKSAYPKLGAHRKEHQEMISVVMKFDVVALKKEPVKALSDAREILQERIFEHMLVADQDFAKYYTGWEKNIPSETADGKGDTAGSKYGIWLCSMDMTDVYLSDNQVSRGHTVLVNKEEKHHYLQLSSLERSSFAADISKTASVLKKVLSPEAFEFFCLEDADERLMYHIVPKYSNSNDYGVPTDMKRHTAMPEKEYKDLAKQLSDAFGKK